MNIFLQLLAFFLIPALATVIPPLLKKVTILAIPIDFGLTLGGQPLFGTNKTWRGFVFGTFFASSIGFFSSFWWIQFLPPQSAWSEFTIVLFCISMALGALAGDLIKSFFKRRFKRRPGQTWFPFDQVDWIIGALVVYPIFCQWNWFLLLTLPIGITVHILTNLLGYLLKINKQPI